MTISIRFPKSVRSSRQAATLAAAMKMRLTAVAAGQL